MLVEAGMSDAQGVQSDHRLGTSIALVLLLVVTCFAPVLLYCLPVQGFRRLRKQVMLPDLSPDWQIVLAAGLRVLTRMVMVHVGPVLCSNLLVP
jgi:hypothetical protein